MTDNPDSVLAPDLSDFYEAWWWLSEHPLFFYKGRYEGHNEAGFAEALDIMVAKVDPDTKRIEDPESRNTSIEVWLECGPFTTTEGYELEVDRWANLGVPSHDIELDVGGPTFEIAICALARRVLERHGSYREHRICSHCLTNQPAGPTDSNEEWFCSPACEEHGEVGLRTEPIPGDETMVRYVSPREYFDCEHWRDR